MDKKKNSKIQAKLYYTEITITRRVVRALLSALYDTF